MDADTIAEHRRPMSDRDGPSGSVLTSVEHWDSAHRQPIRYRLPSALLRSTLDLRRVFRRWIRPGRRVLEIGFAPGKQLAWIASALGASVAGIDYSEPGVDQGRALFRHLGLAGDLRCEDIFATSFEPSSFDVVYSVGVIEHFDDPRPIVRCHFELLKRGGIAVVIIPNYGGVYGRLQRRLDPENVAIHNTSIMDRDRFAALMPRDIATSTRVSHFGRVSLGLVSLDRLFPRPIATAAFWGVNAVALAQPFDIDAVAPWLLCEAIRT